MHPAAVLAASSQEQAPVEQAINSVLSLVVDIAAQVLFGMSR